MKHYSKEFKEEALKLSDEIGVKKAAQQLGIAYYTLADRPPGSRNSTAPERSWTLTEAARPKTSFTVLSTRRTALVTAAQTISLPSSL